LDERRHEMRKKQYLRVVMEFNIDKKFVEGHRYEDEAVIELLQWDINKTFWGKFAQITHTYYPCGKD